MMQADPRDLKLSILIRTTRAPYAEEFLWYGRTLSNLLGAQYVVVQESGGEEAYQHADTLVLVSGKGLPDNIVDAGVASCRGQYVLRLDDDEKCSAGMESWLLEGGYRTEDHWQFPRAHLYQNRWTMIVTPQLWPDHQTRLSVRAKAGGLHGQHAGSPFGGGALAPCHLEHYKFVVRSYEERLARAKQYDAWREGDGTGGMRPFSLPEDHYVDPPTVLYEWADQSLQDVIARAQQQEIIYK